MSIESRLWSKVEKTGHSGCWVWTGATTDFGHGVIHGDGKHAPTFKAHRVSAQLAGMEIDGRVVRHSCDNPPCVNPAHLLVGTHQDNSDDMKARGRQLRGSRNTQAKLTEADVPVILGRLARGDLQKDIAADYGVCRPLISMVKHGHIWTHAVSAGGAA